MIIRESVKVGDKTITIETGRIAKQAAGSVFVSCGETMVLVTVCGNKEARPGQPFFPLTVDYVEKTYAAGKIPGGFFKREGKLRDNEVLTSRLIDRPCRPLFPEGYMAETQIIATVMSADAVNPSDVLAMIGASAAVHISPIPWAGPIAGVRVTRVEGEFIANPTYEEIEKGDCELLIAASKDAIVMVEGEAEEMSEADMVAAIQFGHQAVQGVLELIEKIREAVGKEKWPFEPAKRDDKIDARVKEVGLERVIEACNIAEKHPRYDRFSEIKKEVAAELAEEFPELEGDIKAAYEDLRYNTMRGQVLDDKRRVDGRDYKTVRPIAIEVSLLPRVHGSSLFTRGETQGIVTTTLGTRQDEQKIDGLIEEYWKPFILHYNFPPYSVGETKFLRGPGRREVGHGNLAERALTKVLPAHEDFPYTMRIVSEITESNGSSSMATVCGGSLAMMDAGVPIKAPVAGVAMGLIMEGEKYAVLTDILGDEDHLGDMDFKVCGTAKGITAIQMDIKIDGLKQEIMSEALDQARDGRLHILEKMNEVMAQPRPELSKYAPRIETLKVKPDQIRVVIGPGGKMIKAITDQTGAKIDITDDGTISIASPDGEALKKAIEIIESLTVEPEIGNKYKGVVRRVENYGAFLEIAPGKDGLLHITDMDWGFVEKVTDVMDLGDEVEVMISDIDRDGRIRLSRKALLEKPEGYVEPEKRERRDGGGGGRGRDGGRGRGGRDRDRGGRGGRDRDRGGRGGSRASGRDRDGGRDGGRGRGRDRDR
ncbi:MAG: polyribonucleotide nucleotidyltransferase, partial [Myxococcota bacterium]